MKLITTPSTALPEPATDNAAARKNRFSNSRTAGSMPVYSPAASAAAYAPQDTSVPTTGIGSSTSPSFKDLVDVINPLQHIPVVSSFYRKMTGDEISPTARFIGATVFGGPVGGALALTDIAIKEQTGTSVSEKAFNLVSSNKENETGLETGTRIAAQRKPETSRMAGIVPVWQGGASAETRFASIIEGLNDKNYHIS